MILLVYNLVVTFITAVLAGISVYNLRHFARLPKVNNAGGSLVSVLVPARNEERCLEACVRSLCTQEYEHVEVLVLNDGSTDATATILEKLQREYSQLKVINGKPLPIGWVGKSWACDQLSNEARGEVLIFTDADTVHAPNMVHRSVSYLTKNNVHFFSLVPFQEFGTAGEHIVIPMIHVLYFAYLPNDLILHNKRVSVSAANGQFMCFTRAAYDAVGGHKSVQNSLVEDVFLAKEIKRAGFRMALVDGTDVVSCRMYTSALEVTQGFSKNFFAATNYNLLTTVLFLLHLLVTYVLPLPMLFLGFVLDEPIIIGLAATQLIMGCTIRFLISLRFHMPWWHVFLQPITGLWSVLIGVNSIRWAYSSKGARWKGRTYSMQGKPYA